MGEEKGSVVDVESSSGATNNGSNDGLVAKETVGNGGLVNEVDKKDEEPVKVGGSVSIFKLFAFADPLDYLLIFVGTIGAATHGAALPVFFLFFGKLLDGFGANVNNPKKTAEVVGQVHLLLLLLHSQQTPVRFAQTMSGIANI